MANREVMSVKKKRVLAALLLSCGLVLAACGGEDEKEDVKGQGEEKPEAEEHVKNEPSGEEAKNKIKIKEIDNVKKDNPILALLYAGFVDDNGFFVYVDEEVKKTYIILSTGFTEDGKEKNEQYKLASFVKENGKYKGTAKVTKPKDDTVKDKMGFINVSLYELDTIIEDVDTITLNGKPLKKLTREDGVISGTSSGSATFEPTEDTLTQSGVTIHTEGVVSEVTNDHVVISGKRYERGEKELPGLKAVKVGEIAMLKYEVVNGKYMIKDIANPKAIPVKKVTGTVTDLSLFSITVENNGKNFEFSTFSSGGLEDKTIVKGTPVTIYYQELFGKTEITKVEKN